MSFASALSRMWQEGAAVFTNSGYSFFKIEAHVVCAAVLIILLNRQQNSSDQTEARIVWSRLLFVQILYCISGIIRVLVDVEIIPRTYIARYAVTALNFGLFGAMCWLVFVYIELYQKSKFLHSKTGRFTASVPFWVNIILLVLCSANNLFIDASVFPMKRGVLYFFMMAVNFAYPVAAVILSIKRRSKMTRYERDTVPIMAIYPAFFMVCGPLQDINWRIPFLCYVIVISDIFVYISYADSLVSIDPLTQIPNRNGLMKVLASRLGGEHPELLHLFKVDIIDLNSVNSKYGRTEGDRALILAAGALRKFSEEEHNCYVSRYYGDEFILTADIHDEEELELFIEHIKNYTRNTSTANSLPYTLRVNIGWSKYEQFSKTETISGLIEEADRMLMEIKEQKRFQILWQNSKTA